MKKPSDVEPELSRAGRRRFGLRLLASVAGILVLTEVALYLASFSRAPLTIDIGPSTSAYLSGFTESWEYHPVSARFVGRWAALRVPLVGKGEEVRVSMRHSRLFDSPARVHLYASQRPLASFVAQPATLTLEAWARGGRQASPFDEFRVFRAPAAPFPDGALEIEFLIEDRAEYALAVDWMRFEGVRWTVPLGLYHPRLLIVGVFLLCYACKFGWRRSFLAAGALMTAVVIWAADDPFAMTHVAARITWPALVLALIGALIFRSRPARQWVTLIFLVGYLIKAAGLFHPSFFYADVGSHRRYLLAFNTATGGLMERGRTAQVRAEVGYPVRIAGGDYALPYSPLFYLPFTTLREDPVVIDEAMKHVALAAGAAEVWIVYWLSGIVLGASYGIIGALLAAFLPPMFSRLLFAMWPTIVGHFFDSIAIGSALLLAVQPWNVRRLAGFAAASLASLLTYVVGFLNLGTFVPVLGGFERPFLRRALPLFAGAALLIVAFLYRPFVALFFREILPAMTASPGEAGVSTARSLALAFSRVPLFYGYVYPVLALLGLFVLSRRAPPPLYHGVAAYGLTFLLLMVARGLGGRLFNDVKEILFVGPLVALTAGVALETFFKRGRLERAGAIAIVCGLIAFGIARYLSYLVQWVRLVELG